MISGVKMFGASIGVLAKATFFNEQKKVEKAMGLDRVDKVSVMTSCWHFFTMVLLVN